MSGNPPTASELLDILEGADIVTVIWPDGEKNRLKDEHNCHRVSSPAERRL
jgi:hypothetical protein